MPRPYVPVVLLYSCLYRSTSPMYTSPHSQGMLYTPTVLASTSSFTGWRKLDTFRGGMPTLLKCLAAFCSVGRATEVGFSFCFEVLTAGLRARRICFRLHPFFLKVVLRNSNSVSSLVGWTVWNRLSSWILHP